MAYDIAVTDQNGVTTLHSVFVESFCVAKRLWERAEEIVARERYEGLTVCTRVRFIEYGKAVRS